MPMTLAGNIVCSLQVLTCLAKYPRIKTRMAHEKYLALIRNLGLMYPRGPSFELINQNCVWNLSRKDNGRTLVVYHGILLVGIPGEASYLGLLGSAASIRILFGRNFK
jgi:hypothetical protein